MLKPAQCFKKYGQPGGSNQNSYCVSWQVPADILAAFSHVKFSAMGTIGFPKKIFVHKDLLPKLEKGLRNLMEKGLTKELVSWDGCMQIRKMRLSTTSYSLHSWAAAFDINAAMNQQGKIVTLSPAFVECFKSTGLDWGGDFTGKSKDGMHFQLSTI